MTLQIEIPESVREQLQAGIPDLSRRALEALAIESYRTRVLSAFQVRQMLGHESRIETMNFLGEHGVYPNYRDEEVLEEVRALDRVLGK